MNIVIACGGTGGHLFPGLAIAEVLSARGHPLLILISEKKIDSLAIQRYTEFRFETLPSIGLPSPLSTKLIPFTVKLASSFLKCRRLYRAFQPAAVLGMGGFTSAVPILCGRWCGASTYLHESNAIPGKANLVSAKMVSRVLLGFEACAEFFPATKTLFTGTPVRSALTKELSRSGAAEALGLYPEKTTLLVMGGSQGASSLNTLVVEALCASQSAFFSEQLQVLHLAGTDDEERVRASYDAVGIHARVMAFHQAMEEVYQVADFAVARSGASSLTEFAYFGLPSILIPYPYAAEDHQTKNAEAFVHSGAAVLLQQKEATLNALGAEIKRLIAQPELRRQMADNCRKLSLPNSALRIADLLEGHLEK